MITARCALNTMSAILDAMTKSERTFGKIDGVILHGNGQMQNGLEVKTFPFAMAYKKDSSSSSSISRRFPPATTAIFLLITPRTRR